MPAITPDLLERARGLLLGAAVGDAFGMALEGRPRQHVGAQIREMRPGRLPLGHFTASTGAALTVSQCLLGDRALDREELAAELLAGRKPRRPRSRSYGLAALRQRLGHKQPPGAAADADEPPPTDAGALSRCAPLALAYVGDRNACLSQARAVTRLTHAHPDCIAGSAFLAAMLWHLMHGMAPGQAMLESLKACGDLSETLEQTIRQASTRRYDQVANDDQVQPMLEGVVRNLFATAYFAEALVRAANLGGAAATSGTLAGALAGAVYGHSGIPANWRGFVHGVWPPRTTHAWREAELVDLANRLILASSGRTPDAPSLPLTDVTIPV
jgi:ADP-ribosyl-[dinitrogen reductase] hydrolase